MMMVLCDTQFSLYYRTCAWKLITLSMEYRHKLSDEIDRQLFGADELLNEQGIEDIH